MIFSSSFHLRLENRSVFDSPIRNERLALCLYLFILRALQAILRSRFSNIFITQRAKKIVRAEARTHPCQIIESSSSKNYIPAKPQLSRRTSRPSNSSGQTSYDGSNTMRYTCLSPTSSTTNSTARAQPPPATAEPAISTTYPAPPRLISSPRRRQHKHERGGEVRVAENNRRGTTSHPQGRSGAEQAQP